MALEAIKYSRGRLHVLNQLLLPHTSRYEEIRGVQDGWEAIRDMKVRGAPAIAVVGCLSLAVELVRRGESLGEGESREELLRFVTESLSFLVSSRPTAVNMARAAGDLTTHLSHQASLPPPHSDTQALRESLLRRIEGMLDKDIQENLRIGRHGAQHIAAQNTGQRVTILTHCNTGTLATAGHGTALGVIRSLFALGKLEHVYCTETRPFNQGARLTAYELVYENIPSTLITDSMAAIAMKDKGITAVVVGADRIVANGDTANKVGTYLLAIAAQYHRVPFYVAASSSSWDPSLPGGEAVTIEERDPSELTFVNGVRLAAPGINVWNPAFDVTPHHLITGGIITEFGVHRPEELGEQLGQAIKMP